jgi:putative sporulation protein YtxC
MITVECKEHVNLEALHDRLKKIKHPYVYKVIKDERHVHITLKHNGELFYNKVAPRLASDFADQVIATEEEGRLLQLIKQRFYFQDTDEQQQILAIAKSIIDGEKTDLPRLSEVQPPREVIVEAFLAFITPEVSFCYESFLMFRLKSYHHCLLQYVEMAIDEYKLEQEYQNFVQNLRELVNRRRTLIETIHVVYDKQFWLYDEYYDAIDNKGMFEKIAPFVKVRMGVEIEPSVLVTLIGIAPKKIILYSDDIDTGMIRTIQNVFQERVVICPENLFKKKVQNANDKKLPLIF